MLSGRLLRFRRGLIGLASLVLVSGTGPVAGQAVPQQQLAPEPPGAKDPSGQAPPAPPSPQRLSSAIYMSSPYRSLSLNKRLLDRIGLRIVLSFGYTKGKEDELNWRTKGLSGVEDTRNFVRRGTGDAYRTVEMAVARSPQGGYELIVYGLQVEAGAQGANPDLREIQQMVVEEIASLGKEPPAFDPQQLGYETYDLSYVETDRALAMLKVLGYTTVEYSQQSGESLYTRVYEPIQKGTGRPPIIVKLIDSPKTSLMEEAPRPLGAIPLPQQQPVLGTSFSSVPQIGGTFLHQATSGEPQQRLLILYDKSEPESLHALADLLSNVIDLPAKQILIEALLIEVRSDRLRELGISFETTQAKVGLSFGQTDSTTGQTLPFVFDFDKDRSQIATFRARLEALVDRGEAELLSNPSVLVLDGRQARIQIGQQVPVVKSVSTQAGIISSVDYFPVGIVLNLRPRVSTDNGEITMQLETIVSAVSSLASTVGDVAQVFLAPVVDNRQVQSYVRVADNTPFIIGGLISTDERKRIRGIPLLADIPGLGALFRRTSVSKQRQEVIIVVTPHVVPLEDKYFSYVLPKDSSLFDRFQYRLFRNAYRVRGDDLFDLSFVLDSNIYQDLVERVRKVSETEPQLRTTEPFASLLKGGIPGEEILVRRMLWEIIQKTGHGRHINTERIILFEDRPNAPGGTGFQLAFLSELMKNLSEGRNAVALTFEAAPRGTIQRPLLPPKAVVTYENVTPETYQARLIEGNRPQPDGSPANWMISLSQAYSGIRVSPLELLQDVLTLKRVLELNKSLPLTIESFHIGRQIIFPTAEELKQGYHLIDREAARLFYEVYNYYAAFEHEFGRQIRVVDTSLKQLEH